MPLSKPPSRTRVPTSEHPNGSRPDWGDNIRNITSGFAGGGASSAGGLEKGARIRSDSGASAARYEPANSDRLGDLNDLVDDEGDDAAEGGWLLGGGRRGRFRTGTCGQVLVIVAILSIIAVSIGIIAGIVAEDNQNESSAAQPRLRKNPFPNAAAVPEEREQPLLEMAQRVAMACDDRRLNEDLVDCQELCHEHACCFEGDGYSCEDDGDKDCAVYAGCRALFLGDPEDAATASDPKNAVTASERKKRWGRV